MLDKIKLEKILFIDIETVSINDKYSNLNERLKELWAKKMAWHVLKENKTPEELFEKSAIWAEFGKIVCISVGFIVSKTNSKIMHLKSFFGHNEEQLLESFATLLNNHFNKDKHFLCAHNGKEFDYPYIARRMLINGVKLPKILDIAGKKPWEVKHLDTLELWKFGDYKHYTSLELIATLFNIPSPKDNIDGSMVNHVYWELNDLPAIAEYCQKDVITTCKVLLKMKGYESVEQIQIEIKKPTITN